jgi:hypothetical protein
MTKSAPFTQAQVKRSIAAAKKCGLRVVGIRPDGTVIVYDGEAPIAEAICSALGLETEQHDHNPWDDVATFDEWKSRDEARKPDHVIASYQAPLVGEAWRRHLEKWKEWVRGRPLGLREKRALRELSAIKGRPPRHIKDAGPGTMDRLEARGFVKPVGEAKPGYFPLYEITAAGETEWRKICDQRIESGLIPARQLTY